MASPAGGGAAARGQELSNAAFQGDTTLVAKLLSEGVPIKAYDGDGFCAIHRACVTGNVEMISFLIANGAGPNDGDQYGDSPMHYASFCGHQNAVQVLMDAGADPYLKSKDGKTPAESAAEEGHAELVRYITQRVSPPDGMSLTPKAPSAPAPMVGPPPGSDSRGLDFTTGVLIEGILFKKRANRVVRWRQKYYVASSKYNALYFWTGQDRGDIEGVIKKVRFETIMAIKLFPDKHEGRRWDLKVVTGRVMQLLSQTQDEARKWVEVLSRHLAEPMGAIRLQTVWRMYKAKKRLQRIRVQRERAIFGSAAGEASGGAPGSPIAAAGGASAGPAIIMQGELQKKNSSVAASLLTAFRSRFFVLDRSKRALLYWNSKPLYTMGHEPSKIPILNFAQCQGVKDASGGPSKRFYLTVTTGRTFELHAATGAEAQQWVTAINSVMPKRHIAATQAQRAVRGMLARKKAARLREAREKSKGEVAAKYGMSLADASVHATRIQAWIRMRLASRKYLARIEQKKATARRREEAKKHRLYLKSASKGEGKGKGGTASAGLTKRMEKLLRLKALKEGRDPDEAIAAARAEHGVGDESPVSPTAAGLEDWVSHEDAASGRPFWHNKVTGKTTWCDPAAPRWRDWVEMPEPTSGKLFYMNEANGKTQWKPPKGWPHGKGGKKKGKGKKGSKGSAVVRKETRERLKPRHIAQKDGDGDVFYADTETGTTAWDKPEGFDEQFPPVGKCARWQEMEDSSGSGKKFFFNAQTAETVWKKPEDFDAYETVEVREPASGAGAGDGDDEEDEDDLALPEGWEAVADESTGKTYYFNKSTGKTQWKHPAKKKKKKKKRRKTKTGAGTGAAAVASALDPAEDPSKWQALMDEDSGNAYWFNETIDESTWEEPECLKKARLEAAEGEGEEDEDEFDPSEVLAFSLWVNEKLGLSAGKKLEEDEDEDEEATEIDGVKWVQPPVLPDPASGLLGLAPIDPQEEASRPPLLRRLRNGVVLCKLVNAIRDGSIDERVINTTAVAGRKVMVEKTAAAAADGPASGAGAAAAGGKRLSLKAKAKKGWAKLRRSMTAILESPARDNINLAIGAAQSIGAEIPPHVTVQAVERGSAEAIMAFLWALIRVDMLQQVSVREKPEAVVLLDGSKGEELSTLLELKPEKLLLRWANFQLASYKEQQGGDFPELKLKKLDDADLADGHVFAYLLRELADEEGKGYLPEDEEQAAAMEPADIAGNLLWVAFRLGVSEWFSVESVLEGGHQGHLRLMLLSQLWQWAPNLHASSGSAAGSSSRRRGTVSESQMKEASESLATMIREDAADVGLGREGRTMNSWINSQQIPGVFVRDLRQDLKSGVVLLKVLDNIEPGIVRWRRVSLKPKNRYKMVENCNEVVKIIKAIKLRTTNLSGLDIVDGNIKMIASVCFQLMRYQTLKILSSVAFDGFSVDEGRVVDWANERVERSTGDPSVKVPNFSDSSLSNGIFLLHAISQVRAVVDWGLVGEGDDRATKRNNAKYLLSVARKVGAAVFCSWEDIVEVKSRMISTLVASFMVIEKQIESGSYDAIEEEDDEDDEEDEELAEAGEEAGEWDGEEEASGEYVEGGLAVEEGDDFHSDDDDD